MYLENIHLRECGSLEVICGSMFSGKTEELLRRINRVQIARRKIQIFKPTIDIRYSRKDIVSHLQNAIEAIPVQRARVIINCVDSDTEVIAIDEAQFFDEGIIDVINELIEQGKRVICAGLDMDYLGQPFGPMPQLMAMADDVYKCRAICMRCGHLANFSYRIAPGEERVLLGEKQEYMPLCRRCYSEMMKEKQLPQ